MEHREDQNPVITGFRRIPIQARSAFFGAVLFGLFAQGMGMFNKLSHHDDVASLFDTGTSISSGRWTLRVFEWLEGLFYGTGNTSLPLFNGMVCLVCIGAVAGLLVHLMRIRSRAFSALLGCVMAAFPVITALFAYMFTSHPYMIGLLMMVLSACLICGKRPWWARAAAVCLGGAAVGIYQAYLPVFVTVLLMDDIRMLAEEEGPGGLKDFWKHVGIQALCTAGVMLVYAAGNRFFLNKYQVELSGYQGIDEMGQMTAGGLLSRCATAYREYFSPARAVFRDMYPGSIRLIYFLMLGAEGVLALRLILRTGRKSATRAALLAALFALFPLGCNMIFVMAENVHGLMVYGQVMQALLFVWMFDRMVPAPARDGASPAEEEVRGAAQNAKAAQVSHRLRRWTVRAAACVLALLAVMYARFDNQCYLKDMLHQQEAISYYTTLITRIKSLPGYRPDMEILFANTENAEDPTVYNIDELDFIRLNPYWHNSGEYLHALTREAFIRVWCGADFPWAWDPALQASPEVQGMPSYPADGSIRILNDSIVVVKF